MKTLLLTLLLSTLTFADIQLAPDGTYVNGTPQITPDGSFVGEGNVQIAPDGSYIAVEPDDNYDNYQVQDED